MKSPNQNSLSITIFDHCRQNGISESKQRSMSSEEKYRIIIADSQFLITEAFKTLFASEQPYLLTGTASSFSELKQLLNNCSADLLITDPANFDFPEIENLIRLKDQLPNLKLLILTNIISKSELSVLTRLGIKNILLKSVDREELFAAIESTLKGKKYYSDEILDLLLEGSEKKTIVEESKTLTASEIEIVRLIANGLTTKEIAGKRNVSHHTVTTHRKNIFRKLEVSNASELIMQAIKAGWIDNIEYYI